MQLEEVHAVVGRTPHMGLDQAARIARHIREFKVRDVLELGFCHGVSTCYMAAALHAVSEGGHIVTIDLEVQRELNPSIETLLERLDLGHLVDVYYEPTSYTWRLMRMLEETDEPRFDLCYLDGAHSWFVDGLAFFLVDRLLRPGGWLILDDLNWTYAKSPSVSDAEWVLRMPEEERNTAQIGRVYELLVKRHPGYGDFRVDGSWGYARKFPSEEQRVRRVVSEKVVEREYYGLGEFATKTARRMASAVRELRGDVARR